MVLTRSLQAHATSQRLLMTRTKPGNFLGRNAKRLRNILRWIATGQFGRLGQAVLDQILIKSAPLRHYLYKHIVFKKTRQKRVLKRILAQYYGLGKTEQPQGIKVALILRDGTHYPKSSAFIRLISPLTHRTVRNKVSVKLYGENTTVVDMDTAVCIVQRTAYDNEQVADRFIAYVRRIGGALVIDNDDAFHGIDATHPEHTAHAKRVGALDHLVRAADQIWLSVPALVPSYSATKGKISVVKNSLDKRIWGRFRVRSTPDLRKRRPVQMVYMGTA